MYLFLRNLDNMIIEVYFFYNIKIKSWDRYYLLVSNPNASNWENQRVGISLSKKLCIISNRSRIRFLKNIV
jgi:hypothetical protein